MGTVKVTIADGESISAVERVRELLDRTSLCDPNWNGAEFEIVTGPFTTMGDQDGVCAVAAGGLFCKIVRALEG